MSEEEPVGAQPPERRYPGPLHRQDLEGFGPPVADGARQPLPGLPRRAKELFAFSKRWAEAMQK
eukprot:14732598-Heterocapsa_arctica.AAC.1